LIPPPGPAPATSAQSATPAGAATINNYTYDGIDATYIVNQSQLYFVRAAIPLDTIEEIRIDPLLATAQTGATGGGQVGAASSSGTNQFHGMSTTSCGTALSMPRIRLTP